MRISSSAGHERQYRSALEQLLRQIGQGTAGILLRPADAHFPALLGSGIGAVAGLIVVTKILLVDQLLHLPLYALDIRANAGTLLGTERGNTLVHLPGAQCSNVIMPLFVAQQIRTFLRPNHPGRITVD